MDDLRFLTNQAIQSARRRGATLISLTLSGGEPWMERAALRLLRQAGLEAVKVQLREPQGPLKLVAIEVARREQETPTHQD